MAGTESRRCDICIVGAGPGGLAALSAVLEPYSLDDLANDQADRVVRAAQPARPSVCVVDPQPWLAGWKARFSALEIECLRSPAMAHPDAFDEWGLAAFANSQGRTSELHEPSRELTCSLDAPNAAHAGLWSLPSTQLFHDYCDTVVAKTPHDLIRGSVASVRGEDGAYEVVLGDGSSIAAGTVVLALGFPGLPAIPKAFADVPPNIAFHTEDIARLSKLRKGQRVLVVGGGLTAVQAAQLAMKRGCRVSLCSRRRLVTRNFDVAVKWFDPRVQARARHDFWNQPWSERRAQIKETKGGGSVPPSYMEQLKAADAAGRIELIWGEAEVVTVEDETGVNVALAGKVRRFDHVVLATGHQPNGMALPLLRELQEQWPVEMNGGLPVLSEDLQWGPNKQLFIVGALAGLQVGPDAANLMGCRRAAQVVAKALGLRLWLKTAKPKNSISICGNRYAALCDGSDKDEDSDSESTSSGDADRKESVDSISSTSD